MSTDLALASCEGNLTTLRSAYDACGCGVDPCASVDDEHDYDLPLHVGAVFVILVVSLVGSLTPLVLSKLKVDGEPLDAYYVTLGKAVGTGVVLAAGFIHMLQPAAASLTSACVPPAFNSDYEAYAYLFCMLAAILAHAVETVLRLHLEARVDALDDKVVGHVHQDLRAAHMKSVRHVLQSYTMEVALTVHSVFIGLTVGVVGSEELAALLTALCFHQAFEGVALGARLADAELSTAHTVAFILIFSVSAPVGIACGVGYVTVVNPGGVTYLLVQGIFDGLCAGLLLYVGFQLLLVDFPEDMVRFTDEHPRKRTRRAGMFLALWTGAGFMAFIGRYL